MISLIRRCKRSLVASLLQSAIRKAAIEELITQDFTRWTSMKYHEGHSLVSLFLSCLEFRSLIFYRLGRSGVEATILRNIYPPLATLYLGMKKAGAGLYIQHGFATIVTDIVMGENCWINQQVTIGHNSRGCPSIGDEVFIHAGAIVIGDISIGNRTVIAAGSVVTKSVPPDCVVVGNPAFIIKRNGVRVHEEL